MSENSDEITHFDGNVFSAVPYCGKEMCLPTVRFVFIFIQGNRKGTEMKLLFDTNTCYCWNIKLHTIYILPFCFAIFCTFQVVISEVSDLDA